MVKKIKSNNKNFIQIFLIFLMVISASKIAFADIDDKVISVNLMSQDPDPVISGDVVELRFAVENTGTQNAQNLILELVEEYPFEIEEGFDKSQNLGTVLSGQNGEDAKIIKFKVKIDEDTLAGKYILTIREYEENKPSITKEHEFEINVKSKETIEISNIDKSVLAPGEETEIGFTIENVGNSPLRDITFTWEVENDAILTVGSDNLKFVKYLDVGEKKEFKYKIITDSNVESGLYKLDLKVDYYDSINGDSNIITTGAGIYIGGETDFDVAFSESSNKESSFSLSNIGTNPANSVSVIIPQNQENWEIMGTNTAIIGNLNDGDYTVASFNLNPKVLDGKLPLLIQIAYTDTLGKRHLIDKEIVMHVSENFGLSNTEISKMNKSTTNTYLTIFKYGVVLVIAIFVFLHFRRKKHHK